MRYVWEPGFEVSAYTVRLSGASWQPSLETGQNSISGPDSNCSSHRAWESAGSKVGSSPWRQWRIWSGVERNGKGLWESRVEGVGGKMDGETAV